MNDVIFIWGYNVIFKKAWIVLALNRWFGASPGNCLIAHIQDQYVIRPCATTLLGTICTQLAFSIVQANEMVICHHCKKFFGGSPRARGIRQFCSRCRRTGKPQLYAARDYRRRRSSGNR